LFGATVGVQDDLSVASSYAKITRKLHCVYVFAGIKWAEFGITLISSVSLISGLMFR